MTRAPLLALALAALLGGCHREPATPAPPPLPPMELRPAVPQLEKVVAAAPHEPSDQELAELRQLLEVAFLPGRGDHHLVGIAKARFDNDANARWVLEEGLEHPEPAVRRNAAFRLGTLGDRAAVPELLMRVKYETKDRAARVWVAGALARLRDDAALYDLIDGMKHEETAEDAGREAMAILAAAGHTAGARPTWADLQEALAELYREWHENGVAPAAPGAPQAEPSADSRALLRGRIAQHLLDLREFDLRAVDDTRFILGRMGVTSLPLLRIALHASETYIRQHSTEIALALGKVAAPLTADVLPLLGDPLVETTAVRALGAMQATEALPHLLARLQSDDPELRVAAAEALGPLGAAEATAPLRRLLHAADASMDERVMAAFSLAMLENGGEGLEFLHEAQADKTYHAPTLRELLDRLAAN